MHLAFNVVTAGGARSGVFSYVVRMTTDFPRLYPDVRFTVFITPDLLEACDNSLPNVELVVCNYASQSALKRMFWEQLMLPIELKKRNIDLIYTFSVTDIFFAPCPSVIRVGNMLPYCREAVKLHTGFKARLRLLYLRVILRLSVASSNAALVMSEPAASILIEQHGYPKNKVIGINRGVTLESIKQDSTPIANLPAQYILVVSHIQEHKRLEEVIKAYSTVIKEINIPPLLIVGDDTNLVFLNKLQQLVDNLCLHEKVIFFGKIPRSNLYSVIQSAEIIIFPSMVETFPVTLLEQMLVGSVMIVSNRGVMPYFCGDSVLYYDPTSPDDLSSKLTECLQSEALRKELRIKSKERTEKLDITWLSAMKKRYHLFERIVNKHVI
jgi:glycosyltransferase involved in cell wall biosynthesis